MKRTFIYQISDIETQFADEPCTVSTFLRARGYSRHLLTLLKTGNDPESDTGCILLDGRHARLYEPLHAGSILEVTLREMPNLHVQNIDSSTDLQRPSDRITSNGGCASASSSSPDLPLSIVYEDEDILVVDKPPGMPVHQSAGHRGDTLADAVNAYYAQQGDGIVFRCINRLDRDTSGLVLIAKHQLSGSILSAQMKARQIRRTYMAVVHGYLTGAGTIDAPIARRYGSAISRCIDPVSGELAVTHYIPLSYDAVHDYTCLELHLDTGRTHQIRVHMTSIGHPLVGDFLYRRTEDVRQLSGDDEYEYDDKSEYNEAADRDSEQAYIQQNGAQRQALHSAHLQFMHPISGEMMYFSSPLPEDIKTLLESIENGSKNG